MLVRRCESHPAIFALIANAPFEALAGQPPATALSPMVTLLAATAIGMVRPGRVADTVLGPVLEAVGRGLKVWLLLYAIALVFCLLSAVLLLLLFPCASL